MPVALTVEHVGIATVQDLGRPGLAHVGITHNGASDRYSAISANVLVGNSDAAPLLEMTGSGITLTAHRQLLIAVTGAVSELLVNGCHQPVWGPVAVFAGSRVHLPGPTLGLRSYLAINGEIDVPHALGSVAPDRLMEFGTRLVRGTSLSVTTQFGDHTARDLGYLFCLGAPREGRRANTVAVTPGPDIDRVMHGPEAIEVPLTVSPVSDDVGLRLDGSLIQQVTGPEILSRGVPVGAVELLPAGGVIVLLRARMLTAGYPVIAVVTSASIDELAQARPGDELRMRFCDVAEARERFRARRRGIDDLRQRVATAFTAAGLAGLLEPPTGSRGMPGLSRRRGVALDAI